MIFSQKLESNTEDNAMPNKLNNLEYIFDLLIELSKVAKESNEVSLVYYLEMAALEAGERRNQIEAESSTVNAE